MADTHRSPLRCSGLRASRALRRSGSQNRGSLDQYAECSIPQENRTQDYNPPTLSVDAAPHRAKITLIPAEVVVSGATPPPVDRSQFTTRSRIPREVGNLQTDSEACSVHGGRGGCSGSAVCTTTPDQAPPYRRARSVGSHTNHRRSWRRGTPPGVPHLVPRASSRRRQASTLQRGVQRARRGIENMDVTRPRRSPTIAALPLSSWLGSLRAARGCRCV